MLTTMRRIGFVSLFCVVALINDWCPITWPWPGHTIGQARSQAPYPPNQFRPYRGGVNCIQVADRNGNFNCAPSVTVDPATGAVSFGSGGASPFTSGIALVPTGTVVGTTTTTCTSTTPCAQLLGSGDLILSSSSRSVASAGPMIAGATIRVRASTLTPGYCQAFLVGGNGFQEWPLLLGNPNVPALIGSQATVSGRSGFVSIEFPAGSLGC